MLLNYFHL